MPSSSPVSLKDISRATGYAESTISYALRNHPKIAEPTRIRIQEAAEELGYESDPTLRALMSQMRQRKSKPITHALALLNTTPFDHFGDVGIRYHKVFQSLKQEAETLGYHLDELPVRDLLRRGKSLNKILKCRNIHGVIYHDFITYGKPVDVDWSQVAAISLERELTFVGLDNVSHSTFRGMRLAMRKLAALGYRRVGLAVDNPNDTVERSQWIASYLFETLNTPELDTLSVYQGDLIDVELYEKEWGARLPEGTRFLLQEGFHTWRKKEAPDCILTYDRKIITWLREAGLKVPEDIGFAILGHEPEFGNFSGVDQKVEDIARTTVQQLVARLEANKFGIPAVPRHIRMEGEWVDGGTVCRQSG